MKILNWLLSLQERIDAKEISTFAEWRDIFLHSASVWSDPIERAIAGGFLSDRAGYAFAAGYESALTRLVPSLPPERIVSFCVTEEKGGHPAAIRSILQKAQEEKTWLLNGSKKFATLAPEAGLFLVAASAGTSPDKKNIIRMVLVDRSAPGIGIVPMADLPFVPEIPHGALTFQDVPVHEQDILPDDGYVAYIKPFRTIEDLHVQAAVMGFIFRVACAYRWPQSIKELVISLLVCMHALAGEDPRAPWVHIALGGLNRHVSSLYESAAPYWDRSDDATRMRWNRDKPLLAVAEKSRARRLEKAWLHY